MQNIEAYFKKITIVHLHIINSQRFAITFYMVCKQARLYREKMRGGGEGVVGNLNILLRWWLLRLLTHPSLKLRLESRVELGLGSGVGEG